MFRKDKQSLSIPLVRKVRGLEIKKMPVGAYLSALEKIKEFPENFLSECFPGKSFQEVMDEFSRIDDNGVASLMTSMLTAVPKYVVSFISELCGIDEAVLLNDPEIGLDGLVEIVTAFIEVNNLGEFASGAKELTGKIKALVK